MGQSVGLGGHGGRGLVLLVLSTQACVGPKGVLRGAHNSAWSSLDLGVNNTAKLTRALSWQAGLVDSSAGM